tara:strand:+ start:1351 stop:1998 length:648 start_codon:yes stop_codon:yes gene_type:complete
MMPQIKCINYRSAEPEDIDNLGLLHLKTFNNSIGASIGLRYSKAFFKWFILNEKATTLVCCDSKQIIGYVVGAPEGYSKHLTKSTLLNIIFGIFTHPKIILNKNFFSLSKGRIKNLFNVKSKLHNAPDKYTWNDPQNTTYVLVGIGVDPKFRGQKIGYQILKKYENLIWRLNYKKIRLTVYESNLSAINLYKKSDWSIFNVKDDKMTYFKNYNGD